MRSSSKKPPSPPPAAEEFEGTLQFRSGGSAFIFRDVARTQPAVQIGPEDTGVALPGDRVAVRVYPGSSGRRPGEMQGRVTRVVERARESIVGDLRRSGRSFAVIPDDPRFSREILVADPSRSKSQPHLQPGDKVVVRLQEWKQRSQPITGEIIERLGRTHEPRAELLGVFAKFGLEVAFPPAVEREAAALPARVQARDVTGRVDFRKIPTFTIDPDDAKDFDDALSLEEMENGEVRIGVHIADVSSYVRPGTALDQEAQRRGNSTYLVGTVIPMLPEKLSNGLCSLVEAEDRLCKAALFTFAPNGKVRETTFANTVIRSRKRLTYKQAYALLFEEDMERVRRMPLPPKHQTGSTGRSLRDLSASELSDLQGWIRRLWDIGRRLRADRMSHGSLDLDMPETKIFVDEKGFADRLERIEQDESHQLIEEFMLLANEAIGRLTRAKRLPSLYRVHDDPDPEKLEEFREFTATFGIRVGDLTTRSEVAKLLETLKTHPQGYTLRSQFLRSLKKAAYRSTADGHYGLAKRDYTHFTSPIRRYADLVVHRVLGSYIARTEGSDPRAAGGAGYDAARMGSLADHLSLTEINSADAERESVKIKLLEFFERELHRQPPTRFAAIVTDVRRQGLFVELTESMTFGFVAADALGDDRYLLDPSGSAFVGKRHRKRFEIGSRLEVTVARVDRFKRLIDFKAAADS